MTKQNKIQQRVVIILLFVLSLAGLSLLAYRWVFKNGDGPPIPLPSGYQIYQPFFLAVPNEEALENEDRYSPVISEYVKSFEDLDFKEHKYQNKPYYSISPSRTHWPNFIPRIRTTGTGSVMIRNINVGKISSEGIKLGELGTINLDFGARSNIQLKNTREASMELGDPKFISQLAFKNQKKEHRVYFIDRMYIADLEQDTKAGISASLNGKKSNLADFETEFRSYYKGFSLVLGSEFQLLNSSAYLPDNKFSGTTQEQMAYDLERVLGIRRNKALALSREPVKSHLFEGDKVKIEIVRPFGGDLGNQRIQIDSGDEEKIRELESNFAVLEPGTYKITYVMFNADLAYYLENSITIHNDLSVEIEPDLYDWGAVRWERFNVLQEYNYRNQKNLEKIIERIDHLRKEIFQDALRRSSPFNIDSENSQDLKALVKTAPISDLQAELKKISPDAPLTREQRLRKNLAEYWLAYLNNNQLPPNEEAAKYEGYTQEDAEIKWMQANHKLKSAIDSKDSEQFVEAAVLFRRAAELLKSEQIKDQALIAYINGATLEANKSAEKLQKAEEALLKLNFLEAREHGLAAQKHEQNAQSINNKALDLFVDANRPPRTWLDWLGNPDPLSGMPNLWQRTVYKPGDGVSFKVTEEDTGYVEANNGSIQVSTLVNVDLTKHKYLAWDWKAIELPPKGDLRNDETDDQAIQVVVTFQLPDGSPKLLDYVWDTNAPIGTVHEREVGFPGLKRDLSYLVVESGTEYQNQWRPVRRNLVEDFKQVFRNSPEPSLVKSVTVQTNSWRTETKSAGEVGQIRFTKELLSDEEKLH